MHVKKLVCAVLPVLLSFSTAAPTQSYSAPELRLLQAIRRQPTLLARYVYLQRLMPSLSAPDTSLAGQFRSITQDELGLYTQAILDFPFKARLPSHLVLPDKKHWVARKAVGVITREARGRHIVMINEAHHDAHTRELTLELLPRLRALGFTYFAAEALTYDDPDLVQRGYPTTASGTEYLREPVYGDIVREAIRLGFTIVPYDTGDAFGQARENAQAEHLYRSVFAKHPHARLFVHAGYAHIDKAPGRLGRLKPMAMQLQRLSGFVPLSIDQFDCLETGFDSTDVYHRLIAAFPAHAPEVFVNRATGRTWSDRPKLYDMNVVLPPALKITAFVQNQKDVDVRDSTRGMILNGSAWNRLVRPGWLSLNGRRRPFVVDTGQCHGRIPCVVEARHIHDAANAIPADIYAFMWPASSTRLYLPPGRYWLRAADVDGDTISRRMIRIAGPDRCRRDHCANQRGGAASSSASR